MLQNEQVLITEGSEATLMHEHGACMMFAKHIRTSTMRC